MKRAIWHLVTINYNKSLSGVWQWRPKSCSSLCSLLIGNFLHPFDFSNDHTRLCQIFGMNCVLDSFLFIILQKFCLLFSYIFQDSNWAEVCLHYMINCQNLLTFFLHPCNVLDILHIIETVTDRWFWHGRGCWQTVNVFHKNILGWLTRQAVWHQAITAETRNNNNQIKW